MASPDIERFKMLLVANAFLGAVLGCSIVYLGFSLRGAEETSFWMDPHWYFVGAGILLFGLLAIMAVAFRRRLTFDELSRSRAFATWRLAGFGMLEIFRWTFFFAQVFSPGFSLVLFGLAAVGKIYFFSLLILRVPMQGELALFNTIVLASGVWLDWQFFLSV